jgi:hypothetical protein
MSQLACRCQCTAYQLTPVNGIRRKPNGKYSVYLRLIGEGTTRVLTETAPTYERAVEIRDLAIRMAGVPASAVGLTRVPLGWRAFVRWNRRTYHLGTFNNEVDAAACRCGFDAWAAGQLICEVLSMLELHCRGPHMNCHERLETRGKIDV